MAPLSTSEAALAASVPAAQVAKLRQAAQDFEAMALGQLLQPMFATVDMAHGAFGGGAAEAAVQPMLIDALARNIAAHGGLGLAAPVFANMLRSQEAANQVALRGTVGGAVGGTHGSGQGRPPAVTPGGAR